MVRGEQVNSPVSITVHQEKNYASQTKQVTVVIPPPLIQEKDVPVTDDVENTAQTIKQAKHDPTLTYRQIQVLIYFSHTL